MDFREHGDSVSGESVGSTDAGTAGADGATGRVWNGAGYRQLAAADLLAA